MIKMINKRIGEGILLIVMLTMTCACREAGGPQMEAETVVEAGTEVATEADIEAVTEAKVEVVATTEVDADMSIEDKGYVAGELICLADTREEAEETASLYGIELKEFEYGVAVFMVDKDANLQEIIEKGKAAGYPELSVNYIYTLDNDTGLN